MCFVLLSARTGKQEEETPEQEIFKGAPDVDTWTDVRNTFKHYQKISSGVNKYAPRNSVGVASGRFDLSGCLT